jgi:hypothetical protein
MWENHEQFSDFLADSWNSDRSRNVSELRSKLEGVSRQLTVWNRETFGSVRHQIRTL